MSFIAQIYWNPFRNKLRRGLKQRRMLQLMDDKNSMVAFTSDTMVPSSVTCTEPKPPLSPMRTCMAQSWTMSDEALAAEAKSLRYTSACLLVDKNEYSQESVPCGGSNPST